MDKFDQEILDVLKENARTSVSSIAQRVSLSRSSVSERIKKLEQKRVIKGYQVLLSESQKSGVSVYFEIQHKCARCADLIPFIRKIPEVIKCQGITGDMDLLIFVSAPSMQRIHEIRESLDASDDIIKIKTHVVMSDWV
ncbi:Lrp/AsnC family transcriptional regulator [Agaribacter marinus]|nr:Lrp/AsnC family transcriptional regulator [Agaribacter marinus]